MSEKTKEDSKKVDRELVKTKVDREPVKMKVDRELDIVILMTAIGASILGGFGCDMTFENIITVGVYDYVVGVLRTEIM